LNVSPRVGLAWDMSGDGRAAIRGSYGLTYDMPNGEYELINANSPPFGNRTLVEDPPGGFDHPYTQFGGDPHPILTSRNTPFIQYGAFGAVDPNINAPRIQQWNVTVEKQFGRAWQVEASYLGSYTDRLWNQVAINPGVFLGTGPCTLLGVFYPSCSTNGNLNQRRVFSQNNENPAAALFIGNIDIHENLGEQSYRGMKLSFQRRAGTGLSLSGNYTLSRCYGDPAFQTGGFPQIANGYTDPQHPEFDRGPVRSGSNAHRRGQCGLPDAAIRQPCGTPGAVGLAHIGPLQRAFWPAGQRHLGSGPRLYRHSEPARRSGARESVRGQKDA
jgi:hypothetical protein